MTHDHTDPSVLTFGCAACINAKTAASRRAPDGLSAGRRLTIRNNQLLEAGRHPATGAALIEGHTCGECVHHVAAGWHDRTWHKCEQHRLGASHSASSDIRVSWPACTRFEAELA